MQPTRDMIFSGMRFKDFGSDNCYLMEESRLYQKSLKHLGYKTVEFVVSHSVANMEEHKLVFVEARTTLRPRSTKTRFDNEITDISQKFMDALQIICGVWHGGRKGKVPLPTGFSRFRDDGRKIIFLLVVKNGDKKELLTVADSIYRKLLKENRLWKFEVKVLNEGLAIKENLVLHGNIDS